MSFYDGALQALTMALFKRLARPHQLRDAQRRGATSGGHRIVHVPGRQELVLVSRGHASPTASHPLRAASAVLASTEAAANAEREVPLAKREPQRIDVSCRWPFRWPVVFDTKPSR